MSVEECKSAAGVHVTDTGERVIGGSKRADGTVRKTLKVRPGFTPVEDVKKYDVREARKAREASGELPTQRKSQFAGLSNLLRTTAEKEKMAARSQTPERERDEVRTATGSATSGLLNDFSKLALKEDTAKMPGKLGGEHSQKEPVSQTANSSTKPKSEASSSKAKRYVPPQRRKKYTLADLDSGKV